MLENKDKRRVEQYIDKIILKLKDCAEKDLKKGISNKIVLDNVVNATVGKMTPESKAILSSVYNMLRKQTLSRELYQDPEKKAAYYEANILKELNAKFSFEVPAHIDYHESKKILNKWIKAGAVSLVGGTISISLKSWTPVVIAVVIAGVMALLLDDKEVVTEDIHGIIDKYLENVKQTLMDWISDIENYYDERVSAIEREM